jgi:hypothetical protein
VNVHRPHDREPTGPWLGFEDKYELLMALDGVELGVSESGCEPAQSRERSRADRCEG